MFVARRDITILPAVLLLSVVPATRAQQYRTSDATNLTPKPGQPDAYPHPASSPHVGRDNYVVGAVHRSPFTKVTHYISTHKELLGSDALLLATGAAAAHYSDQCQRYPAYCIETNPILGPHPSNMDTWFYALGVNGGLMALHHLAWHFAPEKQDRHVIWFSSIPVTLYEAIDAHGDAGSAQSAHAACIKSGLCK
jgi:hypothetical protein